MSYPGRNSRLWPSWQRREQWSSSSQFQSRGHGSDRERHVHNSSWFPSADLDNYDGPYPKDQLRAARVCLIESLQQFEGEILERVKPRVGIPSRYGPACPPPPDPVPVNLPTTSASPCQQLEIETHDHELSLGAVNSPEQNIFDLTSPNISQDSGIISMLSSGSDPNISSSTQSNASCPGDINEANTSAVTNSEKEVEDSDRHSPGFQSAAFYSGITPTKLQTGKRWEINKEEDVAVSASKRGRFMSSLDSDTIFRCDFCDSENLDLDIMWNHLKASTHYSASSYSNCKGSTSCVLKKCILKNKNGLHKSFVVVCPECVDLFEDKFQCGLHYQMKHGGEKKCYAQCPVLRRETMWIYLGIFCPTCKQQYKSRASLHWHWEHNSSHHPLDRVRPEDMVAFFPCDFCPRVFYENYYLAEIHAITSHQREARETNVHSTCALAIPIKARFIKKPSQGSKQVVPICVEDITSSDSSKADLQVLNGLSGHYKNMGEKAKEKEVRQHMQYLQHFQNGDS